MKLWEMSWDDAKARKWEEGRKKYGDDWGGDPPLEEFYAEMVDASNYLDEAYKRGDMITEYEKFIRERVNECAEVVEFLLRRGGA